MSPVHLLDPANYSTSPAFDLSTARFERVDATTVAIRLPAGQNVRTSTNHDLTLVANPGTPLATSSGIELTANATIAISSAGDNSPNSVGSARAFLVGTSDPNSVFIEYGEPVEAVGALVAANYALNAAPPLDVTPVGPSIVRLAFASPPAVSDVIDIEPTAAVDLAGNVPIGVISLAVEGPDVTAPIAFFIEGLVVFDRAPDILEAVFSERLDPALATDLGNYSFSQNGAPIDLEGATIEYRDYPEAVVLISLSDEVHLIRGATLEWSVSGLADPFGNAVAPASDTSTIQGDSEAPDLARIIRAPGKAWRKGTMRV